MLERFLTALPVTATSGYAFVAYLLTLVASTYLASRQRRFSILLEKIKELPEADRLTAIRLEMGAIDVPKGFSPEHYLAAQRMKYRFGIYAILSICAVVIFSLAIVDAGTLSASIDLAPEN